MLKKMKGDTDSVILILGAIIVWILHTAAEAFIPEFAGNPAAATSGRFIETIILMVFTYHFTKSVPKGSTINTESSDE